MLQILIDDFKPFEPGTSQPCCFGRPPKGNHISVQNTRVFFCCANFLTGKEKGLKNSGPRKKLHCSGQLHIVSGNKSAALDLYRRRQREQQNTFTGYDESLDAPGPAEDGPMEMLLRREQAVLLRQCVALLPQRELDILNYRYLLELPHKEIARLMGLKPEHVRMLLTRAKRKLLLAYREKGGTDDE